MRYRTKLGAVLGGVALPLALAVVALGAPGCGDGATTGTGANGGSSNAGGGGNGGTGGTAGAGGTNTGGMSTGGGGAGGTGGTGGGSNDSGAPGTDLVCAGGVAKSTGYKMVFTLGQSTQNQGKTTSSSYRMQGGLIGATGSVK